jgi:hypothetical protein
MVAESGTTMVALSSVPRLAPWVVTVTPHLFIFLFIVLYNLMLLGKVLPHLGCALFLPFPELIFHSSSSSRPAIDVVGVSL